MVEVKVKLWRPDARVPVFAKEGDACADLFADDEEPAIVLWPGDTRIIYTGISLEIPPGYEGLVRGRSGLSARGIVVLPGVIDAGYRGRIGVMVHVASRDQFMVRRGDRLAQLAIREVPSVSFTVVDELSASARGTGGFGSTGAA